MHKLIFLSFTILLLIITGCTPTQLSGENEFLTFDVTSNINAKVFVMDAEIIIKVPNGTNMATLTVVKPIFTVSSGATVTINNETQVSGESIVDFSTGATISYVVTASNGTSRGYQVIIEEWPSPSLPSEPRNFSSKISDETLYLGWKEPESTGYKDGIGTEDSISKYRIYYSTNSNIAKNIGNGNIAFLEYELTNVTTEYLVQEMTNNEISPKVLYYFVVFAVNSSEEAGTPSKEISAVRGNTNAKATITSYSFSAEKNSSLTNDIIGKFGTNNSITVQIAYGTSLELIATYTTEPSNISFEVEGNVQESGITSHVFTLDAPVTYSYTDQESNVTREYVITLSREALPENTTVDEWKNTTSYQNLTKTVTGTPIRTRTDLRKIMNEPDGEYYLANDIVLDGLWNPIGSKTLAFTGTIHGNGHIIYNLEIDNSEAKNQGLFALIEDATIDNLGIVVSSIRAKANTGALSANSIRSTLQNIAVFREKTDSAIESGIAGGIVGSQKEGSLVSGRNYGLSVQETAAGENKGHLGGLVGTLKDGVVSGELLGSTANISTIGGGQVGGLVGKNNGGTVDGFAEGYIRSQTGSFLGGLVGANNGVVIGTASGNITSETGSYLGGLVGDNDQSVRGTASGNISSMGGSYLGGLVGANNGVVIGTASGDISSQTGSYLGGLVGESVAGLGNETKGMARGNVYSETGDYLGGLLGSAGQGVWGYSLGWVYTTDANTNTNIGAALGAMVGPPAGLYYNSDGGDHVGNKTSGTRNHNNIGVGINGIANATTGNMLHLAQGSAAGNWTFTQNEWPKISLPNSDYIRNYIDYTDTPTAPQFFID